ncbi:MAG: hypothetical protein ACYC7A_22375, partial [Thermoanaerobaculia bacterium]
MKTLDGRRWGQVLRRGVWQENASAGKGDLPPEFQLQSSPGIAGEEVRAGHAVAPAAWNGLAPAISVDASVKRGYHSRRSSHARERVAPAETRSSAPIVPFLIRFQENTVLIITSRLILALLATLNITASAGAAEVLYKDDFQSYGTQKNPPGWVDNAIGKPAPTADGLYKTWPDPTEGNKGTNVVFGTKQSSGKPEGTNPR